MASAWIYITLGISLSFYSCGFVFLPCLFWSKLSLNYKASHSNAYLFLLAKIFFCFVLFVCVFCFVVLFLQILTPFNFMVFKLQLFFYNCLSYLTLLVITGNLECISNILVIFFSIFCRSINACWPELHFTFRFLSVELFLFLYIIHTHCSPSLLHV